MNNKIAIFIILSGVLLLGCLNKPEESILPQNNDSEIITVKFIEKYDEILNKNDFPDFKLISHVFFITPENRSVSLDTENFHGSGMVNASEAVPEGYRVYGSAESHFLNDRYLTIQYKVFDDNEKLNDSLNLTAMEYIRAGFKTKNFNFTNRNERIFVLERNLTNISDMNITIIMFKYDTVLGKIGVQDAKNRSFNESLSILDNVLDKIEIRTKEVFADKEGMFASRMETENQSVPEQIEQNSSYNQEKKID